MQSRQNKKVFVAMSGGVDSSVAALLLKKQGYDVTGVFMKYWMDENDISSGQENRCCSLEARRDAMRVCAHLGIPFLTWDFQKEFKKAVVDDFIRQYKSGLTPNPCVVCNKEIKLGLFLKKAIKGGVDFVATGHYVRVKRTTIDNKPVTINKNKKASGQMSNVKCQMFVAEDNNKDQSYFLYNLTQKQLKHILFPLGDLIKTDVRKIAEEAGLPVALKKDSQEVCFVKDANLRGFLKTQINTERGPIIEATTNKIIGEHDGAQFYTIGQRAPVGGIGPYYVIGKNLKKNQLIVAKSGEKELFRKEIFVKDVNWISGVVPKMPFRCYIKTRYQQPAQKATIIKLKVKPARLGHSGGSLKLKVLFKELQRGVAPGQSAVFYKGKEIIGGGIIE